MRKFFRKLRALGPLMEAMAYWPHVFATLVELSESDPVVRDFRLAVDKAWRILKYGKA